MIFADLDGSLTNPISKYPLYDPQKGIYKKWGDIKLPWSTNLDTDQWQIAEYYDTIAYTSGELVLRVEDDGYRVVLYEALGDISSPPGAFDPSLWTEVCRVVVSEPVGLQSYQYLVDNFEYYKLSLTSTTWSDFNNPWGEDPLYPYSDLWGEAKSVREFFYKAGDIVLYDSNCGDYTCIYVAKIDMPADPELITTGPPSPTYWQKQYCVFNGLQNKCVKVPTCTNPGRKIVSLGRGNTDIICVSVESNTGVRPRTNGN